MSLGVVLGGGGVNLADRRAHPDTSIVDGTATDPARHARELESARERGMLSVIDSVWTIVDGCDRVVEFAGDPDDVYLRGMLMLRESALRELAGIGFRSCFPLGEPFDPNAHEAIGRQGEGEMVVKVVRRGWFAPSGALVRAAQVIVGAVVEEVPALEMETVTPHEGDDVIAQIEALVESRSDRRRRRATP